MASFGSLSTEQLRRAILDHGFCYQPDPVVGERVTEMQQNGFPFKTVEGLDFCKLSTFDDKRIRSILESIFEWSGLGCYKALGESYPDRIFSFLNNIKSEAQALIIQLWRKDSRIAFYKDSHLYPLEGRPAANGFLEIPPPNLAIEAIERIEVDMKEGGLYDSLKTLFVFVLTRYRAVIDARLGFTVIEGVVINFGFATKEELKEWATMKLPNLPEFKTRVISMTRENIGNNFELIT